MLNEYEIVAWSLWLDTIALEDDDYTVEEKTLFTAFYVKISLNNDSSLQEIFEAFFNHYMPNFIQKFNNWISVNSNSFMPHPVEMNQKYIQLSRPYNPKMEQDIVEYNYIVDDILQISPPYQLPAAPNNLNEEAKELHRKEIEGTNK